MLVFDLDAWLLVPQGVSLPQSVATFIRSNNVRLVPVHYNSIWTRDYGPIAGILEEAASSSSSATNAARSSRRRVVVDPVYRLGHVRPLDESVPCQVAAQQFQTAGGRRGRIKDRSNNATAPVGVPCQSTSLVMDGYVLTVQIE
jgi:hypothetical protein